MAVAYDGSRPHDERLDPGLRPRCAHRELRIVSYLSAEFLIGPQLGNNLLCVYEMRDPD